MPEVHEGGCLCGAIRYCIKGNPRPLRAYVCHCTDCQQRTGSAFATIASFKEQDVELTGDGFTTYEHPSTRINRSRRSHFCNRCGTTFMWTADHHPGVRTIMVGTLDDPNWVEFDRHIWTRSAQRWVLIPDNVDHYEQRGANG